METHEKIEDPFELRTLTDGSVVAVCEACGEWYDLEEGYYEDGEYSYCRDCCHW